MLKRTIPILIASGVLGAQVNVAAAQGAFPSSADESGAPLLPEAVKYLEQRAAGNLNLTGASRPVFPTSASSAGGMRTPLVLKYLEQRASGIEAASTVGDR